MLRITLRCATLLLLGAAVISFAALSGEYPGATAAGRQVAAHEVLPLALLAWTHLGVLDAREHRPRRWWAVVAVLGDSALLVTGLARAWQGGPPLTVALPVIAALLLVATIGVAWRDGRRLNPSGASLI